MIMGIPLVKFGEHYISKLILGGNLISGFSHISPSKDKEMIDYHNTLNVKSTLDECLNNGINTFQARGDRHIMRILNEYSLEGKHINWIAQTASEIKDVKSNLKQIASNNAISIYHHGTNTDNLWHTGIEGIKKVEDNLKMIRDTGLIAGLGTHRPEVIDYVEEKGWDFDFYMTSLYNLAKEPKHVQTADEFKEEEFEDGDAEPMLERIKQTDKQCLVFKILGAGRKATSPLETRSAFEYAFQNIKPNDCVVVGMYQRDKNQVLENAKIVKDILKIN